MRACLLVDGPLSGGVVETAATGPVRKILPPVPVRVAGYGDEDPVWHLEDRSVTYVQRTVMVGPPSQCEGPGYPVLVYYVPAEASDLDALVEGLLRGPARKDRVRLIADQAVRGAGGWLEHEFPGSGEWQCIGRRLFRGRRQVLPTAPFWREWIFVLYSDDWSVHCLGLVSEEMLGRWPEVQNMEAAELGERLRESMAPECPVLGCVGKGLVEFGVRFPGRVGGVLFDRGSTLRVCPEHACDVWMADGPCLRSQVAEWVRPWKSDVPGSSFALDTRQSWSG